MLALIRPDSWNFPLFIHILGATVLVGGVLTGASAFRAANGNLRLLRLGYGALLYVALPGLVVMRIGAALIWHKYKRKSGIVVWHLNAQKVFYKNNSFPAPNMIRPKEI